MHRRRKWYAAVPLLAAVISAGSVFGDGRPGTGPSVTPPVVAQQLPAPFNQGPFAEDPYARRDNNQADFPSAEVHGAVDANARAAFARAQLSRMQYSLDQAIRDVTHVFEGSVDYKDVQKAEQQAWEDYTNARNSAIRPLLNDAKYQANVAMKEHMGDKIVERREEKANIHEIVILAHAKLDYAQVARDMEITLIKNDSNVAEARRRLIAAGHRMTELRAKFDESIRTNADLIALRHGIEDARIAAITAEAYKAGAVEAANQSLDYAYYKNRFNANYNGLGYPYGYGVYPVRY